MSVLFVICDTRVFLTNSQSTNTEKVYVNFAPDVHTTHELMAHSGIRQPVL